MQDSFFEKCALKNRSAIQIGPSQIQQRPYDMATGEPAVKGRGRCEAASGGEEKKGSRTEDGTRVTANGAARRMELLGGANGLIWNVLHL